MDKDRPQPSEPRLPLPVYPKGFQAQLRSRLDRLPIKAVKSRTDVYAVYSNENRFVRRVGHRLGLSGDALESVAYWHTAEVIDRLPDVKRPDESLRIPWHVRFQPRSNIGRSLIVIWRNPITIGLPSWIGNRRVSLRAFWLRLSSQQ